MKPSKNRNYYNELVERNTIDKMKIYPTDFKPGCYIVIDDALVSMTFTQRYSEPYYETLSLKQLDNFIAALTTARVALVEALAKADLEKED